MPPQMCPTCKQVVNPGWPHFELAYGLDIVAPTGPSTPRYKTVLYLHPYCLEALLPVGALITTAGAMLSAAQALTAEAGGPVPQ